MLKESITDKKPSIVPAKDDIPKNPRVSKITNKITNKITIPIMSGPNKNSDLPKEIKNDDEIKISKLDKDDDRFEWTDVRDFLRNPSAYRTDSDDSFLDSDSEDRKSKNKPKAKAKSQPKHDGKVRPRGRPRKEPKIYLSNSELNIISSELNILSEINLENIEHVDIIRSIISEKGKLENIELPQINLAPAPTITFSRGPSMEISEALNKDIPQQDTPNESGIPVEQFISEIKNGTRPIKAEYLCQCDSVSGTDESPVIIFSISHIFENMFLPIGEKITCTAFRKLINKHDDFFIQTKDRRRLYNNPIAITGIYENAHQYITVSIINDQNIEEVLTLSEALNSGSYIRRLKN